MNEAFRKFDLTGKTALVTGGASGLGYYMARGLMRSGAKVMIAARREEVLRASASKLRSESQAGLILHHRVDLADRNSIKSLVEHAAATMGGVDILVGNAALSVLEHVDNIKDETIDAMLQVNVASNIALFRAFVPGMRQKKWGRAIFVSSATSIAASAQEGMGVYTVTKGALNAFTRTAAAETGHDGITVNSIILGAYVTELMEVVMEQVRKNQGEAGVTAFNDMFAGMTAIGRIGRSDEVEGVIQFLASDAASYVTGAHLVIDGGMSAMLRPNPPPSEPVYPKNL